MMIFNTQTIIEYTVQTKSCEGRNAFTYGELVN